MTAGGLRYDRTANGDWVMRAGPDRPFILVLAPLFEEMNRTRALIAGVMRGLAALGHASALLDLPGTGESETALEAVSWEDWRASVSKAAAGAAATVALRGGCLLDDAAGAPCAWRLAPVDGSSLIRDLERSGMVSGGGGSAGYDPDPSLVESIRASRPLALANLRTVRLASDRGDADFKLEGPPLWRRSEPQNSSELVEAITTDIDQWARRCGAF